jgi:hypothetical protein
MPFLDARGVAKAASPENVSNRKVSIQMKVIPFLVTTEPDFVFKGFEKRKFIFIDDGKCVDPECTFVRTADFQVCLNCTLRKELEALEALLNDLGWLPF